MLKTMAAILAVLICGSSPAKAQPNQNPDTDHHVISHSTIPNARAQRKFVNPVKLTVRNFPLHRIFADDDDDSFGVAEIIMHHRREIKLQIVKNDDTVSDSIALRLWLIRQRVLEVHKQHWG